MDRETANSVVVVLLTVLLVAAGAVPGVAAGTDLRDGPGDDRSLEGMNSLSRNDSGVTATDASRETLGESPVVAADHVVDRTGDGNYTRIQAAVDAATAGETILVRDGEYSPAVVLNQSVTLVGQNATLNGSALAGRSTALTVAESVTISGFEIGGYDTVVRDRSANATITVSDLTVEDSRQFVDATGSSSDWRLANVSVHSTASAITAVRTRGNWTVTNATIRSEDIGIDAAESTGGWTVSDSTVRSGWSAVSAGSATGDWSLSGVDVWTEGSGVLAPHTTGNWTVSAYTLHQGHYGMYAAGTDGDWHVSNTTIATGTGIKVADSSGTWTVSALTVQGGSGLVVRDSTLDLTASNLTLEDGETGLRAHRVDGQWSVSGALIQNMSTGISLDEHAGRLDLSRIALRANRRGLVTTDSTGKFTLRDATISHNAHSGLSITGDAFWRVRRTDFDGLTVGIAVESGSPWIAASNNWWGQISGPTDAQINLSTTGTVVSLSSTDRRPALGRQTQTATVTIDPGVAPASVIRLAAQDTSEKRAPP